MMISIVLHSTYFIIRIGIKNGIHPDIMTNIYMTTEHSGQRHAMFVNYMNVFPKSIASP